MAKANPNRHISRTSHYNAARIAVPSGYLVRFSRRGKHHQAYFSDNRFGGPKKALAAARAHRDEMESKFRLLTPVERANVLMSTNTSGTVGIRWTKKTVSKGSKKYTFEFAVASWSTPAGRLTRSFSAEKYGRDEAWKLAIKARKSGLAQLAKTSKS
jgi:hypothetical protein